MQEKSTKLFNSQEVLVCFLVTEDAPGKIAYIQFQAIPPLKSYPRFSSGWEVSKPSQTK